MTGDISALTANLHGQTVTVTAFVSWAALPNGDQNFTGTITCGTAPTTTTPTTVPIQVSPEVVTTPASVANSAIATAPAVVAVTRRLTG